MIHVFGDILLWLALVFSLFQSLPPLWGYLRKNPYALAFARSSAYGQMILVMGAFLLLSFAFLTDDFSIAYVAANSHASLPFMYKLTALWGAHEGSILLWIVILNAWAIACTLIEKENNALPLIIAIFGLISFCFLSFLLLTSNPFLLGTYPIAQDLNPLLQDPGFVTHPPMLYAGYVGFSATFAITQAALITGQLDKMWARTARTFAIAAWSFLTLGITLGSWWAYRVLGWGGFWFWDPVENASLLPWLSGTALIHVLLLAEKRETAKAWAALLSIITFALSVLGTFLVRSGVLISAHTFANDPARGVFLLLLLGALSVAALFIYMIRITTMPRNQFHFSFFSRESGLLLNSTLLFVAMLIILLGTLYPLLLDAFHLGTISVGAPYFNTVMAPFAFMVMLMMGFVPFCHWHEQPFQTLWQNARKTLLMSFISAVFLYVLFAHHFNFLAITALFLSFWIIFSTIKLLRSQFGMTLAHVGFAVLIIGVILSTTLNEEREVRIRPGNAVNLGPYQFFFLAAERADGANYYGARATFEVIKNKRYITHLYPEKRRYKVRDMVMTHVDIHPSLFRDLYLALGEPLTDGYWSVRIYYKPFVRFIWVGGLMMMIGGLIAISPRLLRLRRATTI